MEVRLKIGNKLALILISMSLLVIALISALFYVQFDRALKERVLLQLSSVKQLKIFKIKNELEDRIKVFETFAYFGSEDSAYFEYLGRHPGIPTEVMGYPIKKLNNPIKNEISLIDLTIHNPEGKVTVGFLAFQDSTWFLGISVIPEIQEILLQRTGLGQTGESYIVGADSLLMTKSRFFSVIPWEIVVKTEGVIQALSGVSSEGMFPDYRGVEVFSSYEKIDMGGLNWVILSEMDHQEALFPLKKLRTNLIYILLILMFFILVVSYFLSRMIVSPVLSMEKKLITMSRGVLEGVKANEGRQDEIGQMFEALNRLVNALTEVIVFAGKIGSGDFEASYTPLSEEDKLGKALIRMKEQLKEFQQNEQRLIKENQQSILNGEEKERSRLSREMHDGLGPLLTTLRINIQTIAFEPGTKRELLNRIDDTINEVRRMSNNLMPSVLTDFGSGEAIGNLISQIGENAPVLIRYKNDMKTDSLIGDSVHITIYRIAQEAINNALKHSSAKEIKVSLTEFDGYVSFYISDNGNGFDLEKKHMGNGIRNMKERVKVANGTMDIRSSDNGTTIEVEIPTK